MGLLTWSWDTAGKGQEAWWAAWAGSRGSPWAPPALLAPYLEQTEVPRGQASGPDDHGVAGSSGIGPRGAAAAGLGPPEPPRPARGSVSVGAPAAPGAGRSTGRARSSSCQPRSAPAAPRSGHAGRGGQGRPTVDWGGLKGWPQLWVNPSAGLYGAASVSSPAKGCE